MELRILSELSRLLPLTEIRDENCCGKTQKNGFGISPVTVGENWFRKEASKIAPVVNVNSLNTGKYRNYLGLTKLLLSLSQDLNYLGGNYTKRITLKKESLKGLVVK